MFKLIAKLTLKALGMSLLAGLVIAAFTLPGHFFPGVPFSTSRAVFAAVAAIAFFVAQIVLIPILIYSRRSAHPKEKLTVESIDREMTNLFIRGAAFQRRNRLKILFGFMLFIILLVVIDSLRR